METKTALVTGASSGIGEATAEGLTRAGYKVYGISRRGVQAGRVVEMDEQDLMPGGTSIAVDYGRRCERVTVHAPCARLRRNRS